MPRLTKTNSNKIIVVTFIFLKKSASLLSKYKCFINYKKNI